VTETVDIVINAVNDPPEAVSETITTSEDQTVNITLKGSDVDGQTQFTYNVTQMPTNGTLTGQIPSFTYTPDTDFTGTDTIKFTVSDGFETSAEGTITLNIGQADDPPVWGAGTPEDSVTLSVDEGDTLTFTALATDPDGDTITYALMGLNDLNGASFDTASGEFSWSPNYEDIGEYDVTLKATDPFNPAGIERRFKIAVLLVDDDNDNLPKTYEESIDLDPTKADTDGDTINDNVEVGNDIANPIDTDNDGTIDALDQDSDGDGLRDSEEAGRTDPNQAPNDADSDGVPDYRETDSDNDGTDDPDDNCPFTRNSGQENLDGDAFGDVCDDDRDNDGVPNNADSCATVAAATDNGCPPTERRPPEDDEGCAATGMNTSGSPSAPMMLLVALLAMVGLGRRRRG
jgi:MYXO-CTERM domain-containing protein